MDKKEFKSKIHLISLALILYLIVVGCGTEPIGSGLLKLNIIWKDIVQGSKNSKKSLAADNNENSALQIDCVGNDISDVEILVYYDNDINNDSDDSLFKKFGPFSCIEHNAKLTNLPVGEDIKIMITAKDSNDNILYKGIKTGVKIEPSSQNSTPVSVTMTSFTPKDIKVTSGFAYITFCWSSVEDATDYYVYMKNDYPLTKRDYKESKGVLSSNTCLTWENLDDRQNYYFIVTAINKHIGESKDSEIIIYSPLTRISVDKNGNGGTNDSIALDISGDGRYIAFSSDATNLVDNDNNGKRDIYRYDMYKRNTVRITDGNGNSNNPSISNDGKYITYTSEASDIVAGDSNGFRDIFLYDSENKSTKMITQGDGNSQFSKISDNAKYIVFESDAADLVDGDTNNMTDIFLYNIETEEIKSITDGDNISFDAKLSPEGKYVVFISNATNIVPDDTNEIFDVFLYNIETGETIRVSVDSNGKEFNNASFFPSVSLNGEYISFQSLVTSDSNSLFDIFVHKLSTGETFVISANENGELGNNSSFDNKVSLDGKYIVYESYADNLVSGDTNGFSDIFLYNLETNETKRVNIDCDGSNEGNGDSFYPSISNNGSFIAFQSDATNLVPDDNNGASDIFVVPNSTCM